MSTLHRAARIERLWKCTAERPAFNAKNWCFSTLREARKRNHLRSPPRFRTILKLERGRFSGYIQKAPPCVCLQKRSRNFGFGIVANCSTRIVAMAGNGSNRFQKFSRVRLQPSNAELDQSAGFFDRTASQVASPTDSLVFKSSIQMQVTR